MGQAGQERAHQAPDRRGHPVERARNHGDERAALSATACNGLLELPLRARTEGSRLADRNLSLADSRLQVSTIYITCPAEASATLGIKLPFLVMIIKNLKKYFSFEVQVRQLAAQVRRGSIVADVCGSLAGPGR